MFRNTSSSLLLLCTAGKQKEECMKESWGRRGGTCGETVKAGTSSDRFLVCYKNTQNKKATFSKLDASAIYPLHVVQLTSTERRKRYLTDREHTLLGSLLFKAAELKG